MLQHKQTGVVLAAGEFLPAVRNFQVLSQVVNGKGLALVVVLFTLLDAPSLLLFTNLASQFYLRFAPCGPLQKSFSKKYSITSTEF
jgi:hypothetical protein